MASWTTSAIHRIMQWPLVFSSGERVPPPESLSPLWNYMLACVYVCITHAYSSSYTLCLPVYLLADLLFVRDAVQWYSYDKQGEVEWKRKSQIVLKREKSHDLLVLLA